MSLVPYSSRENRDIVLQHRNALVVRDPASQTLEIRGLSECPTCHRPLRSPSPERQFDIPRHNASYVDPNYFRMLRDRHVISQQAQPEQPPSSPVRRLVEPVLPQSRNPPDDFTDADYDPHSQPDNERNGIHRDAFSQNYFNSFFVEEQVLGRGGKGVVLLVRHEIDGCHLGHFACKRVPVGDDHAWLEKVLVEVELLAKLSHPNLVSYRHVWLENVRLNRFGPTVACAFILQQYCNSGDLHQYVIGDAGKETTKEELKAQMRRRSRGQAERPKNLHRCLSFEEIFSLFKDITAGLAYLHAASYIHRDLKPSNCLLHREGGSLTCLISDFGEVQHEAGVRKSTGSTGTISWCAPEVLTADSSGRYGNFTTKSDIFSLGMILYFMCFGRLPYDSANTVHEELEDVDLLRAEIADWQGFSDERRERPDLPPRLYQLLKRLLDIRPANRPSAAEVLNVMKNETTLEGSARPPRSPSPSLSIPGRRIQPLDSPLPHRSPSSDRKDRIRSLSITDRGSAVTDRDGSGASSSPKSVVVPRLPSPSGLRHRPSAARSQDSYTRTAEQMLQADSPPLGVPLLIAPPELSTISQNGLRGKLLSLYDHFQSILESTNLLRIGLFILKIVTLTRPCLPFVFNLTTGLPLVLLAAFDLGAAATMGVAGRAGSYGQQWGWGIGTSLGLFVLHLCLVWFLSRVGMLCASLPDRWTTF